MTRRAVSLLTVASVAVSGCGGGDDGDVDSREGANARAGMSEEAKARAAVAAGWTALLEQDAEAACETLTEAAQRQAVKEANRLDEEGRVEQPVNLAPDDCVGAATVTFEAYPDRDEEGIREARDAIESGESRGEPVRVALTGDRGTVTVTGDVTIKYRVERVDGEWLVADPGRIVESALPRVSP